MTVAKSRPMIDLAQIRDPAYLSRALQCLGDFPPAVRNLIIHNAADILSDVSDQAERMLPEIEAALIENGVTEWETISRAIWNSLIAKALVIGAEVG